MYYLVKPQKGKDSMVANVPLKSLSIGSSLQMITFTTLQVAFPPLNSIVAGKRDAISHYPSLERLMCAQLISHIVAD